MYRDPIPWDRINSFALVSYIPDPLAGFLDRLRRELVPTCFLRAHVTILPPRPVSTSPDDAWSMIREIIPHFAPFQVEMTGVEVFPASDVIYISVGRGSEELKQMHDAMAVKGLGFQEAFAYHPHVTLAQDLKPDELDELVRVARARWNEFRFDRSFRVEKAVFVQNTRRDDWLDIGECTLGHPDSKLFSELTDLLVR
ncbi:MAG TPA: 2'-5' RNA ligase family protein [Bryobacteraceae bacterium]|nr:2'-5' RNA ligase family protein [Bryobacteraceae bacterium]